MGTETRHLNSLRDRVRQAVRGRHEELPAPSDLHSLVGSRKMWHRKVTDPDFGHVRIGTVRAQGAVPELPVAISLRRLSRVTVSGGRQDALDLTRAMLAHLGTFHHPLALRVVWRAAAGRETDWEWLRWLPHTGGTGSVPYTVFVLDEPALSFVDDQRALTIIDVTGGRAVPAVRGVELVVEGDRLGRRTGSGTMPLCDTDRLDRVRAEAVARRLTSQGGAGWWSPASRQ